MCCAVPRAKRAEAERAAGVARMRLGTRAAGTDQHIYVLVVVYYGALTLLSCWVKGLTPALYLLCC